MDIKELREKINGIDNQISKLFLKRMELVRGVAEYKRDNNLPILDAAREQKYSGIFLKSRQANLPAT